MTPQEQQLLKGLTDRVNQTVLNEKDPDAERYLGDTLGRNPDALYIMAQTVLVQQYALEQAKKQLDQAQLDLDHARQQAQQQTQQPKHASSFLGNLLGMNDDPAPPPPPPQQRSSPQYAPVQTFAPPAQPQYAPQPAGMFGGGGGIFGGGQSGGGQSGGGGFLRSAMTTATGVAAGALAFEGIESLMHGFGNHAGYGSNFDGGMGGGGRPQEVTNNYYGDAAPAGHDRGDLSDRFAAAGDQPSSDIEDRRDDGRSNFADTSSNDDAQTDDSSNFDDSSSADDSSDDSSSSDDSGSSDGGF